MSDPGKIGIAVIGGGISGITAAKVLKNAGFAPVIFEKGNALGGIWANAYPGVRLQNIGKQYRLSDFRWPFKPDFHPTGEQILEYFRSAVEYFQLDLRLGHEVLNLEEQSDSWVVRYKNEQGIHEEAFGYLVIASGQYSELKRHPDFQGDEQFQGEIVSEREIRSHTQFNAKNVLVVGFGKTALDMATFAAQHAKQVYHLFRTPRWTVPESILGIHITYWCLCRLTSIMMPSWMHPSALERFLHRRLGWVVRTYWRFLSFVIRSQEMLHALGKGPAALKRLRVVQPEHILVSDMRSAGALAPRAYYEMIADGRIEPYHAELASFSPHGVRLKDGREIFCDLVILSLGSESPKFPFMPEKYRKMLEAEKDGPQLYRHLIHPRIPHLGFAGFNHGFMHITAVEVGTLWLCAQLRGELKLPSVEKMEREIERIRLWKRQHINFEPSRSCAVNTRYQQYLDLLLQDLEISPYRKLPNIVAEIFARYGAKDYRTVFEEYERKRTTRTEPLIPQTLQG